MPEWTPNGYVPSPPQADLEDIMTSWGKMPRWKARALAIGEIQAVFNDAAKATNKPAPDVNTLIADALAVADKRRAYYKDLYDRCDAAEARCDALLAKDKAKKNAAKALADAEEKFTEPPTMDDIAGMSMN
jgi:hypothetical protein